MSHLKTQELLQAINWRYAVKKFDPSKKVSAQDWATLEEVLRLSPSSYGLQPWKFVIVQSEDLRKSLRKVSWNQSQVEECSHYVVFTTLKSMTEDYISRFMDLTAHTRGIEVSTLNAYKKVMMGHLLSAGMASQIQGWTQRQAYIAMGNLMNAAALLAIDTCPIEGLDPKAYDDILGITQSPYATVAAVAVGYRHAQDGYQQAKKVRFSRHEIIEVR